jgi:hypothetical protein
MYNRGKEFSFGSSVICCEWKTVHFWYEACKAYREKGLVEKYECLRLRFLINPKSSCVDTTSPSKALVCNVHRSQTQGILNGIDVVLMLRKTSKKRYTYLSIWNWLLEKLTVAQSLNKLSAFLQTRRLNLPSSQDPATICHLSLSFFLSMGFRGKPSWLFVPPPLDVPILATRCPRAYRRVPHSSGGSWNLWAGNKDR